MSWQLLGAIGIVMIVAAVLGGGLKVAGVGEIPVVRGAAGVVALLLGGLVFLGMGYLTWRDRGPAATGGSVVERVVDRVMDTIDTVASSVVGGGFARPQLNVSPDHGRKTAPLTLSGTGYQAGERIEVKVHMRVLASPLANENGSFVVRFRIPRDEFCPSDQCQIIAQGKDSLKWTTVPYDVDG